MARKTYEIYVGNLDITYKGVNVQHIYKAKDNKVPYLCTNYQDGQHIIGTINDLTKEQQEIITNYIKSQL